MPAMIFDTCCGCIELKTGCLIIGYLELVGEIILSIVLLLLVAGGSVALAQDKEEVRELGGVMFAIGIILVLLLALLLAFTITLLVGLHQNKRGHVKAYLIYAAIFLVLGTLNFFGTLSQAVSAGTIISNIICLALHCYFMLVIRSYYHKMNDSNKGQIYNTA